MASYLMEHVSTSDLIAFQEKANGIIEIVQSDWYKKFLGDREVYVLQAIVVDKARRGTGVFRNLISPILKRAEQKATPIVLQTHVFDHVLKYEHVGFKLMEKVVSDNIELVCYNLLKNN